MNRYFLIAAFTLIITGSLAQEIITGLQFNEAIRHDVENRTDEQTQKTSLDATEALQLPFFDDFSTYTLYPDETKWIGNFTFINKYFPLYPPNAGAATFDAINGNGEIYENARGSF